jgi:tetratricopeptide (TPR) repeat protein
MIVLYVIILALVIFAVHWLLLIVHEAGHVVAGRLLGYGVLHVRLGGGSRSRTFFLRHCAITVGPWPSRGEVWGIPLRRSVSRMRAIAFSLAGPIAEASLAAIALLCVIAFAHTYTALGGLVRTLGGIVVVVSAFSFALNLMPFRFVQDGRYLRSDGLSALRKLLGKDAASRPELWALTLLWGDYLCQAGESRGVRFLRRAARNSTVRQHPALLAAIATTLQHFGNAGEAVELCRDVLARPLPHGTEARLRAADALAATVLRGDRPDLLAEALQVITSAVEEFPEAITLRATLGALLYESGETERAEAILTEVAKSRSAHERGIASAYLAVAHAARGDLEYARFYRDVALEKAGDHPVVQRILPTIVTPEDADLDLVDAGCTME